MLHKDADATATTTSPLRLDFITLLLLVYFQFVDHNESLPQGYARLRAWVLPGPQPRNHASGIVAEMRPAFGGETKRQTEVIEYHHTRRIALRQPRHATDRSDR